MIFDMTHFIPVLTLLSALSGLATAHPTWDRRDDAQTSLTLDPKSVVDAYKQDGTKEPGAVDGQTPALTSPNNFINFCLTQKVPPTAGKQVKDGSCNQTPMGVIAGKENMPSVKFVFPPNGDTSLKPNQAFTVKANIKHLALGSFSNADSSYFQAPQTTDGNGDIIGHTHIVIESIPELGSTTATDPKVFVFFKGVNGPADGTTFSVTVDKGLPKGVYRLSTINSSTSHQPVLVGIAQHGALDDMVYFTVGDGQAGGSAAASGKASGDKSSSADGSAANDSASGTPTGNGSASETSTGAGSASETSTGAGSASETSPGADSTSTTPTATDNTSTTSTATDDASETSGAVDNAGKGAKGGKDGKKN